VFTVVTGKVIRYDEFRGYGFISPDNGSEDVFVHINDLLDGKSLFRPGLRVAFEVEDGERGLKASQVRVTDPDPTGLTSSGLTSAGLGPAGEDGLCDLLTAAELRHEITEALLTAVPSLTGEQIRQTRDCISRLASAHNWVEP
jgi:cold shock CspA family protein